MKAYYYNHSISVTTTNYKLPSLFLLSEVLILSGLQIGGSNTKQLALSLLSEYVSGGLGSAEEASKICRVIIAGDSITHEAHDKEQHSKVVTVSDGIVTSIKLHMCVIHLNSHCLN